MSESTGDRERRVDEAIAWYYRQAEARATPDPDAFLARFPDVRTDLQSFLTDKAAFERAAHPADPDATVTVGVEATPAAPLGRVRYFGDYELLAEIARGGMGVVYKARQVSLNRVVALKMILSGQLASAADIERFRQEAEAAANLDHPNILPIYEVGEHDSRQYFSMKLVEGGSLAQSLQSPGMYVPGLVALLIKVCRAVHFAHQRGILHRDLKPSNILLDPDGTPYVTDFGLAKKVEGDAGLTQSGALVGTPSYMAPEQARAEKQLSTGVDVYSLGAILYELLTGRPPFRGAGVMDTVLQVLNRDPDDPRKVNPKADRDLGVIALKCLAKEPAKRYESAAALAEDLERWQRGEPIIARPAGPRERLVKWVRRNPVPAAFTAVILLLLVSGLTAVTRLYFRSEHFRQDAEHERDLARGRLARQFAEKAGASADQWNPYLGLPWLVEALKTTDGTRAAELHRLHLGLLLQTAPGLVHYSPTASCVALHPDGQRVAVGERDGVELLSLGGDRPVVPVMKLSGPPTNVLFSPDGKRLLVAGGVGGPGMGPWQVTKVRVFDADTGEPVGPEAKVGREKDGATSVRFSADGSVVVALWQGHVNRHVVNMEVYLYDAATMQPIGKPFIWGHPEGLEYVQIDYRHLRALVPCRNVEPNSFDFSGLTQVWDLRTSKPLFDPLKPGEGTPIGGFSPTGEFFALQVEKTVRLYHAATGKPAGEPMVHPAFVLFLAYRPDGKVVATHAKDGEFRTWDPATGKPVESKFAACEAEGWYEMAYSPDGRTLYLTGRPGLAARDAETGLSLLTAEYKDTNHQVAFSPDGVHAVTSDYEGVHVWRRANGHVRPFLPHGGPVRPAFSPDGRYLATSGNGVRVWDLAATGPAARPALPPADVPVVGWALSPTAERVVRLDADGHVRVFDARTGEPAGPGFRPPGEWQSADLSPDGTRVVTVGWATGRGQAPSQAELAAKLTVHGGYVWKAPRDVGVWDAATGRAVVPPLRNRTVDRVWFGADGKSLLVAGPLSSYVGKMAFESSDDETEFAWWDLETGEPRAPVVRQPGRLTPVDQTADGTKVLMLVPAGKTGDGRDAVAAEVWAADGLVPGGRLLGPPLGQVMHAVFRPDGRQVLTVSNDGEAQVWDVETGAAVAGPFRHTSQRVGEKPALAMAAFGPDGRRVATASDNGSVGEARVWDVATGRPVTPVLRAHGSIRHVGFSPDGRLLVTLGIGRETAEVRLWEADTGMPVSPPLPVPLRDTRWYGSVARDRADHPRFTPDGRRLLVPGIDGPVAIDLVPEARPAADLEPLARILAGHEVDAAGGFQPLSEAAAVEARDRWRALNPAPRAKPAPALREELARSAVAQDAHAIAAGHLAAYLRDHPDALWARVARANVLEKLRRPDDARAEWDEVVRRADGPSARSRRGDVLASLGNYPAAAADFAAAWAAAGRPGDGARLALCQWAAGDKAGYRKTCEQLRDRSEQFTPWPEGLGLAVLACGLDPDSGELLRPVVPLLEGVQSVETWELNLIRALALAYVRTGAGEKVIPLQSGLNWNNDYYSRHWAIQLLVLPRVGGPLGLSGIRARQLAVTVDAWYVREKSGLEWWEHVIVPELRRQGQ